MISKSSGCYVACLSIRRLPVIVFTICEQTNACQVLRKRDMLLDSSEYFWQRSQSSSFSHQVPGTKSQPRNEKTSSARTIEGEQMHGRRNIFNSKASLIAVIVHVAWYVQLWRGEPFETQRGNIIDHTMVSPVVRFFIPFCHLIH